MSNLAKEWELDTLSCYWDDTAACERALSSAPRFAYAVRSSGSAKGHLVLVQHTGQGRLDRTLFRRLAPACWASGAGDQFNGSFAELVRHLVPKVGAPLVRERLTASGSIFEPKHNPLLRDSGGTGETSVSIADQNAYSSVTQAYLALNAIGKEMPTETDAGAVWKTIALANVLKANDAEHADADGVSLASRPEYHFELDSFGANVLLSGHEPGTYLVRLKSNMASATSSASSSPSSSPQQTKKEKKKKKGSKVGSLLRRTSSSSRKQKKTEASPERPSSPAIDLSKGRFVASFVAVSGHIKHMLIQVSRPGGFDTEGRHWATLREFLDNNSALSHPLSRKETGCDYLSCDLVLSGTELGEGVGGAVYLARLAGKYDVAVKRLHVEDEEGHRNAMREADFMLRIAPHENVCRLFGAVLTPLALVVELCDGGSLDQVLGLESESGGRVFSADECEALALGMARGIAHLHACKIVHRDIAARNVLLHQDIPKITDFGMSRLAQDEIVENTTQTKVGPIKWMAPEQLRGAHRVYSYATDVFSYCVTLTELCGNTLPWSDEKNIAAAIRCAKGERTPIPERTPPILKQVIEAGWAENSESRPTMEQIVAKLEGVSSDEFSATVEALHAEQYDDIDDIEALPASSRFGTAESFESFAPS